MATLIATANGNLTGSTTFAATEVGASALSMVRANNTTLATAATVTSVAFTVTNGKVIDGVLLYLFLSSGTAGTGTFKVDLQKGGVSQASVTVNKSDLPDSTNPSSVPVFFKFTGTATGDGGSNWTIVLTNTSGTGSGVVTYQRSSATSGDMVRALRTTTTQAPAAADNMFICGELTGAGTHNTRTVTMDSTAATAYGNGSVNSTSVYGGLLAIGPYGTLTYGTSASTNYVLRLAGDLILYQNGTYNMGTSGTPIPSSSSAVLEFQPAAASGDFGFRNQGGTRNICGSPRTSGKSVVQTKLTADAAAAATSLTVANDTGWLSGDAIIVASTTQTAAQSETVTLSGNAGSSTMSIGALANAHSGTSPTQAEVGLLTRNVKIRSTSNTLMAYVYSTNLSTDTIAWAEFTLVGVNVTNKRGVEFDGGSTANPKSVTFCSIHDCNNNGFYCNSTAVTSLNVTFSNNVLWNSSSSPLVSISGAVTNGDWTFDSNLVMKPASYCFLLGDVSGTFTNNVAVSSAASFGGYQLTGATIGTFSGNSGHSGSTALVIGTTGPVTGVINNFTAWRNGSNGNDVSVSASSTIGLSFNNLTLFGTGTNFNMLAGDYLVITGTSVMAGDTTFSSTTGIRIASNNLVYMDITEVDMSGTTSIFAAHTGQDFSIGPSLAIAIRGICRDFKSGAPTLILSKTFWDRDSYVSFPRFNAAGSHRTEVTYGTLSTDTSIYNLASPSMSMTPNSVSSKLESATKGRGKLYRINSGQSLTLSAAVRKSVSGDGGAYNGNQPRLVARANPAIGITSDTVLATYSASAGSFNVLSGTTPTATDDGAVEIIVDCDGTAGKINVDDWALVA